MGMALVDDFTRTVFALAALDGHTQFELDVVKALALRGMLRNLFFGDTAANTNNHGKSVEADFGSVNSKCEFILFAFHG